MPRPYHQGPQSAANDDGTTVEFLGHMLGVRYRDGDHTLLFDAEFLAGGKGRILAIADRPIANWDPPRQSVRITEAEATEIRVKLLAALQGMGHEPRIVEP